MLFIAFGFNRRDINIFIQEEEYGKELEQAALENAAFYNTSEVVFTLGQDHITHLNTHFPKIDRRFQAVKQGEDPVAGYNYIFNALSNTTKHVQALKDHPFFSGRFKEYITIQKHFEQEIKILQQEIQKLQDQAQKDGKENQQVQLPPEVQQKLYIEKVKALDKIERTNRLSQATQERKRQDFEFKKELASKQVDENIKTQKELAELKKDLELLKASTKGI